MRSRNSLPTAPETQCVSAARQPPSACPRTRAGSHRLLPCVAQDGLQLHAARGAARSGHVRSVDASAVDRLITVWAYR